MISKIANTIKFLLFFYLLFLGTLCFSQRSLFEKTKRFNSGYFVHFGTSYTGFLNKNFQANVDNKILKWSPGLSIGYTFISYPILFDIGFFSSNFSVSDYDWDYPENTIISHRGVETSINAMLLPHLKYIQPYIGFGYNNASVGVGLFSKENTPKSSVSLSTFVYKCGLMLSFSSKLKSMLGYQRSREVISNEKSFNRLSFSLLYKFN